MKHDDRLTYEAFEQTLKMDLLPEEKVRGCLSFMKKVLEVPGGGRMKDFWRAKDACIEAFKGKMNPQLRKSLWTEYTELTAEAKKLKSLLDEQSSFVIEQIDEALEALEVDIQQIDQTVADMQAERFPKSLKAIVPSIEKFVNAGKELVVLSAITSRLTSLRNETLQTEMRIKNKNKILKRIAELGDLAFPRRKALLASIHDQFVAEVDSFAEQYLGRELPAFILREEIKTLQRLTKELALPSSLFAKVRDILAKAWEDSKEINREQKEKQAEEYKAQEEQITAFKDKIAEYLKDPASQSKGDALVREIDESDLPRKLQKELRDSIIQVQKEQKEAAANLKKQKKQQMREQIEKHITDLEMFPQEKTLGDLQEFEASALADLSMLQPTDLDRLRFEVAAHVAYARVLIPLVQQEEMWNLLHKRQSELKFLSDKLRREAGLSGLDFEKSMAMSSLLEQVKRLIELIETHLYE